MNKLILLVFCHLVGDYVLQNDFMIFGILLFWFTYAIMPVGNGINTCIFNENPRESHSLGFSIP